jgi:Domain of unknown function (DUF4835)
MRKIVILFIFIFSIVANAQELNCSVTFNTDQVGATNQQVFKTLQKSLQEFMNNTKWSTQTYKNNEKIDCSLFFNITSYDNINQFEGTLQVQASRPAHNSTYMTPILNINDKDIAFTYTEYQNLNYDINSYDSNLISIVAFYANMIVGIDGDTFALEGGTKALVNAQTIVNVAQQSQAKGWSQAKGNQNRYFLINDMISPTFSSFRKAMYEYHMNAIDKMSENQKLGKENIKLAIKTLKEVGNVRPNAYLTRVFFDTKSDELVAIFSDGPKIEIVDIVDNLNTLSPLNSSKWGQIRF